MSVTFKISLRQKLIVVEKMIPKYTACQRALSRDEGTKLSGDVVLKIFYYVFLLFDNMFDNVSNGYKTNQMITIHHRQMSNEFTRHRFMQSSMVVSGVIVIGFFVMRSLMGVFFDDFP